MKIDLTYERAIEILRYDAENGVLMRKLKNGEWRVCGNRPSRSHGYGQVEIDGKMYLTHRLAWLLTYGEWPEEVDHIDRDRMNNRIENLRAATRTVNNHNAGLRRDNSSGHPGVCFDKHKNKYKAQIRVNGKQIHLGYYPSAEEAHVAYMLAKIDLHPTSPISQEYLRELTLAG